MNLSLPISTIMTHHTIKVLPHTTVSEIEQIFERELIHHLPVVDENDFVVGIISKEDIRQVSGYMERQTTGKTFTQKVHDTWTAQRIMTHNPYCLNASASLALAADMILKNHFHAIPVVKQKRLVGILTSHDLLNYAFAGVVNKPAVKV